MQEHGNARRGRTSRSRTTCCGHALLSPAAAAQRCAVALLLWLADWLLPPYRRTAGCGSFPTRYSLTLAPNLSTLPTRSCLGTLALHASRVGRRWVGLGGMGACVSACVECDSISVSQQWPPGPARPPWHRQATNSQQQTQHPLDPGAVHVGAVRCRRQEQGGSFCGCSVRGGPGLGSGAAGNRRQRSQIGRHVPARVKYTCT